MLESLRNQLQIRKVDHEKIMSELAEEERALLSDPARQFSAEKVLQLETYARVLESYLEGASSQPMAAPMTAFSRSYARNTM